MPHLDLDGLRTHYQQSGSGPDVVLVHAFTSNLAVWMLTPIVHTLSQRYRVTCYDLRGHGLTQVTPDGYTSAHLAEDLGKLHRGLELEPAILIGHSYGGVIAVHAALQHPELARGIILSDTYFPGLCHLEPEMGQSEPWKDLRDSFAKMGIDLGPRVDFSRLFRVVAELGPDGIESLKIGMGAPGVRWLSQMGQLAETTAGDEMFEVAGLTAERIRQLPIPVAALYDEFSPFEATREYLEKNLQKCTSDVVPGAKHLAPVQSPAKFVELVQLALRRIEETT